MTRIKQLLIILVGLVAASATVVLGIWQLNVYNSQGADAAQARAALPAVELSSVAPASQSVIDGYGRTVMFSGRYQAKLQLLVPVEGSAGKFRVLSGLVQDDGSVVPVIRGVIQSESAPAPPTGTLDQMGVLLPSEEASDRTPAPGQIQTVRLASLSQVWNRPMVAGFVTLSSADAAAQGIAATAPILPEGQGRLRNGAYALQWWVFGAFAMAMAIRMARDFGLKEEDRKSVV